MTDVSTPLTLPEALGDEYGDNYYLQGHVEPALAVLAVVADLMNNSSPDYARDFLLGGHLMFRQDSLRWDFDKQRQRVAEVFAGVSHYWAKQDPEDDERMISCEPDDEYAEAWTRVKL